MCAVLCSATKSLPHPHRLRKDPLDPIDSGTKVQILFKRLTDPEFAKREAEAKKRQVGAWLQENPGKTAGCCGSLGPSAACVLGRDKAEAHVCVHELIPAARCCLFVSTPTGGGSPGSSKGEQEVRSVGWTAEQAVMGVGFLL